MIKWRLRDLVEKLLSFKFVMFVITTVLRCFNIIGNAEWLTIATVVIAGHETQKGISKFLGKEVPECEAADSVNS